MSENDESQDNPGSDAAPPAGDEQAAERPRCARAGTRGTESAERVAALEAEKAELKDRMLRIAAEFDNYKKRMRKEVTEHEVKAREAVLREFLEMRTPGGAVSSWKEGEQKSQVRPGCVDLVLRLSSRSWNAIR